MKTNVVEEVGEDVCILENLDEHAIKRQVCEAEKKKLIEDGLAAWTWQITWTAVTDSVPTDLPLVGH
jgi:hypothetical protein